MKNIRQSKSASLLLILFIYIIAFTIGILTFSLISELDFVLRLFILDIAATVIVYLYGVVLHNSSVYDPYWSVAPLIIIIVAIVSSQAFSTISIILLCTVTFWSIRLTSNWVYTFDNLNWQDWRYTKYKNQSKKMWQFVNFFGINLMPTLIVFCAMFPIFYGLTGTPTIFTYLAALLAVAATLLELVSDSTMHNFKKDPDNKGKVCQTGLYRYSRHPNYLGEITFWWAIYLIVLSIDIGLWWTGIGALINTALFVFISIPLMEKRQIIRRPEYKQYIETTSMLLLLPPKEASVQHSVNTGE